MNTFHSLYVPASFDQLSIITAFITNIARQTGFDDKSIGRIELAIDEACCNIIEHAYTDSGNNGVISEIRIEVENAPKKHIHIVILDKGKPFNPSDIPDYHPSDALKLKSGGLGLYLMRQVMDTVSFEFDVLHAGSMWNRLTLVKKI